ncbi:hypothetical protein P691DRAFT_801763 [Macrolepiota fuliginosa MF-IS2]|uniref:G domain-containing protein n=1 Tax=Macrolepiota fuliginosa MF-IS2 TaxID=1400762 RepID=A0A9P6C1I7_9AGAR|nr:hypothetical protein P691DRAFT_801763 [Macrolepiota fuliginosa MF-IS2]
MGPTGAGKSNFIQKAINRGYQEGVGHSLDSHTKEVCAIRVSFKDNIHIVLLDTPGFDDTNLSDTQVLGKIGNWLKSMRAGSKLAGILYLHRISDNRMGATPLRNLTMFKELCGGGLEKIILTTTMWPEVGSDEREICVAREGELKGTYWRGMIERESTTRRFENTQASAWRIIDYIIIVGTARRWIKNHEESLQTEVGQWVPNIIGEPLERQNILFTRLKDELSGGGEPGIILALLSEVDRIQREGENTTERDVRKTGSSLWSRVFNTIRAVNAFRRR